MMCDGGEMVSGGCGGNSLPFYSMEVSYGCICCCQLNNVCQFPDGLAWPTMRKCIQQCARECGG